MKRVSYSTPSEPRVCAHCKGAGFVDWIKEKAMPLVKTGLRTLGGPVGSVAATGLDLAGLGRPLAAARPIGDRVARKAEGPQPKSKRALNEKLKKRNEIVRKVMREYGLSLPEASALVKRESLA